MLGCAENQSLAPITVELSAGGLPEFQLRAVGTSGIVPTFRLLTQVTAGTPSPVELFGTGRDFCHGGLPCPNPDTHWQSLSR